MLFLKLFFSSWWFKSAYELVQGDCCQCFAEVNGFTHKQNKQTKQNLVPKRFFPLLASFFFPLLQLWCKTHEIQFRTSPGWNLRRRWSLTLILEHLFVPLLKKYCRQGKHFLRHFRALNEHLLELMFCQFAGEEMYCSHSGSSVSQSWF